MCKYDEEYKQLVKQCAEQGRKLASQLACAGIFEPLYLYYRKSAPGKSGQLFLVHDSAPNPYGYELATGEGLRCNVPYDNYFQWIFERARKCPIMSY